MFGMCVRRGMCACTKIMLFYYIDILCYLYAIPKTLTLDDWLTLTLNLTYSKISVGLGLAFRAVNFQQLS